MHAYAVQADGSLKATHTIPAGNFPTGIAYGHTPLGDRLYVADNLGGAPFSTGLYEDPPGHEVRVINPATSKVMATIDLGLRSIRSGSRSTVRARRPTSPTGLAVPSS